jgi:hypothetical protein
MGVSKARPLMHRKGMDRVRSKKNLDFLVLILFSEFSYDEVNIYDLFWTCCQGKSKFHFVFANSPPISL